MKTIPYVNLEQAESLLKDGHLLALPTETVYGLAANVHDDQAVANIFKLKGRPSNHPLIVHVAHNFDIEKYAKINNLAQQLIAHFWPGPLSLVLPKTEYVSKYITGNQDTVAIRCPKHTLTQKLLANLNFGVAAPSANRFGYISPTQAQHVYDEYINHDMQNIQLGILDGGACNIGLESTILQVYDNHHLSILRHGMLTQQYLENILNNITFIEPSINTLTKQNKKLRVSGDLDSHYAPHTPLKIKSKKQLYDLNDIDFKEVFIICFEQTAGILLQKFSYVKTKTQIQVHNVIKLKDNVDIYAQNLYANLRYADTYCCKHGLKYIYIEDVLHTEEWYAIIDRLTRASHQIT